MQNKKTVHLIPHTHWDREWYYSSVNSKVMCYWSMKYMIDYLIKNPEAKFLYDGQTSVVEDFLEFAPDWKEKMQKVIKSKQLMVGPWYTQTDNLQPIGESIVRNLEIGQKIAQEMGHSMKVGYLPDSFGHNPQTPQILRQVGLDNFTFYRGLDPKKVKNKLYFDYIAPSGDKVLGVWQTHYFTSSKWRTYEGFMKTGYKDRGTTGEVTVESYDKRTLGGPMFIPMGGDMRNFEPGINDYIEKLNEDKKFNFKMSSYEEAIEDIQEFIKNKKIKLTQYKGELRDSFTGRAHRSIISARMDLKQRLYDLESSLVEVIEPLSVVAAKNGVNVPWKMIERTWKDLFKTSAHDSYGGCVEDLVNRKMMQRLEDALLITRGVETMLMKIMSFKHMDENKKNQVFVMNLTPSKYTGPYKIQMSYEPEDEGKEFSSYQFLDEGKIIPHLLDKRTENSNNNRTLDDVTLYVKDIEPFSIKMFNIKYSPNKDEYVCDDEFASIESDAWKVGVEKHKISLLNKKTGKTMEDCIAFVADESAGDTYDHSNLNNEDRKIFIKNVKKIKKSEKRDIKNIEIILNALLPGNLEEWETKKVSRIQEIKLRITLFEGEIFFKVMVVNKCHNLRVRALISLGKRIQKWEHDMQYYVVEKENHEMDVNTWDDKDENGDKWLEFPTKLAPHQKIIRAKEAQIALITRGTKEHEITNYNNESQIALTLYRALDTLGRANMNHRPGRASGRPSDTPDAQLLGVDLVFEFCLKTNDISNERLYKDAHFFNNKPYYVKDAWDVKNPLDHFKFDVDFYKRNNGEIHFESIPKLPKGLVVRALYKDVNDEMKLRVLNISEKTVDFQGQKVVPWKLINVKI